MKKKKVLFIRTPSYFEIKELKKNYLHKIEMSQTDGLIQLKFEKVL